MRTMALLILMLVSSSWMAHSQEIYRWVDEKGAIHFTDDFTLVPEKYRDQVQKRKSSEKSAPEPARSSAGPEAARPTPESTPEKKDLLGRGEDWWRAKVKEWNDKLANARQNYEQAYADFKVKEKEYEDSKFKPDKFKRKLRKIEAEKKEAESNVKHWEEQMEEAKNMLEKVLPKQAENYKADPAWLKPKE
jgi:chromosome segregation ATPase